MKGRNELTFTNSQGKSKVLDASNYATAVHLVVNMGMAGWCLKTSRKVTPDGQSFDNTEIVFGLVEEYLA